MNSIVTMAIYLGIHRAAKELKPTGIPVLDDLRNHAYEIGMPMSGLDRLTSAKATFFKKAGWLLPWGVNYPMVLTAIAALDGEIYVEWED